MNGGFRRREFIGGALSAGAFAGARAFAAPHGKFLGGKPECVFGVVSDIHVNHVGADEKRSGWSNNLTFRHALEWFRENSADAVVLAGDMTNRGTMDELAAVAEAWYRVFPGDRAPDGRKVEKVFVMGNHDFHGYLYGNFAEKVYPDMAERRRHVLRADFPGFWKKFFNEDYSRLFRKTVKGYLFIGEHWDDGIGMEGGRGEYAKTAGSGLEGFLKKNGEKIDRSKPFFYVQHPHLKGTCYGDWSCGTDSGVATRALSAYPNAVAISGHSHYSITDERSIWQGAFTSVGAGSLYRHPDHSLIANDSRVVDQNINSSELLRDLPEAIGGILVICYVATESKCTRSRGIEALGSFLCRLQIHIHKSNACNAFLQKALNDRSSNTLSCAGDYGVFSI